MVVTAALAGWATRQVSPPPASADRTGRCKASSTADIAFLFDGCNQSLPTGHAQQVVAHYAQQSLRPTVSNHPRFTPAQKLDSSQHFPENSLWGKSDLRVIERGCNTAWDAGLYTLSFAQTGASVSGRYSHTYRCNGSPWRITRHRSSAVPEKKYDRGRRTGAAPPKKPGAAKAVLAFTAFFFASLLIAEDAYKHWTARCLCS